MSTRTNHLDAIVRNLEDIVSRLGYVEEDLTESGSDSFYDFVDEIQELYARETRKYLLFSVYSPKVHIEEGIEPLPLLVDRFDTLGAAQSSLLTKTSKDLFFTIVHEDDVDFQYARR